MAGPLRVLINAQLTPGGRGGGVEQFLLGLVRALGRLTDGGEEYILITNPRHADWLNPYLGPNQRAVPAPERKRTRWDRAKALLGPLRSPAGTLWRGARSVFSSPAPLPDPKVPESGGFFESFGADLIHFPTPEYTRSALPVVYNPHDLQHLHYPQFFSPADMRWREVFYPAACHEAQVVATDCAEVKRDLVKQFGLDPGKIFVVRWSSPTAFYEEVRPEDLPKVQQKFGLPRSFAFYPAQTWIHKNHIRLLEAIGLLRDRHGIRLNLVCTGAKNRYWPTIRRRVRGLKLGGQVRFLGYVSPGDLRALYHLAQFLVFPSLFEGGGLPVVEGLEEGAPVVCSDIPPLREYGGDAVLTFDPQSVECIAARLKEISGDEALRERMRQRGRERMRRFTWERTGKTYRALYRKAAKAVLSEEDLELLSGDTALEARGRFSASGMEGMI